AQVSGIDQRGTIGIELRHKSVLAAAHSALDCAGRCREVVGGCAARYVDVARGVEGDSLSRIIVGAAEIRGINQRCAGGIQFRYESVADAEAAIAGSLERALGCGEIARTGAASH